jgi:alpha-tubulin suppressor-like RCC1 family protein
MPWPPRPELIQWLHTETFDAAYRDGLTNAQVVLNGYTFDEDWSGYALQRAGPVVPFLVPVVDGSGQTNLLTTAGAIRFWFLPFWTSSSVPGGLGSGAPAILLEIGVASVNQSVAIWSLQASADGSTLSLVAQSDSGPVPLLSTPISWQAGDWVLLTINYDASGIVLIEGDQEVAQTTATLVIPPAAGVLALGSTLTGSSSAGGDFEEFWTFAGPLDPWSVTTYYNGMEQRAVLGPVTQAEIDAENEALEADSAAQSPGIKGSPLAGGGPLWPDGDGGGCITGGPVYLTNVFVTDVTTQSCTVVLAVGGGTNGIAYCLYSATNLVADLTDPAWRFLQYVYACDVVTLSNQDLPQTFYVIAPEKSTVGDGIPDSWKVLHGLNPLDPSVATWDPDDDGQTCWQEYTNNANPFDPMLMAWGNNAAFQSTVPWGFPGVTAMAAGGGAGSAGFTLVVTNQGRVAAWGGDTFGQTDVPAGLSNVVAVAAGGNQAAALTGDGGVVQWGQWFADVPASATNVTAISAGYQHFLALRADATVVAWGNSNCPANCVPTGLTGVKAIGAGWNHNVALRNDGTLAVWGQNAANLHWNLTDVPAGLTDVAAISVGALHSVVLRSNGTVVAWGCNTGHETDVPDSATNVVAIAAGRGYTLALRQDQTVVGWGAGLPAIPSNLLASSLVAGPGHALAQRTGVLTPLILEQPQSQGAIAGGTATFRVRVSSRRQPAYQWQWNDADIAGATNDTLTISNMQDASQGNYRVRVTNGAGTVDSDEAELVLILAPVINWPTVPQTLQGELGGSLMLAVSATAQGWDYSEVQCTWYRGTNAVQAALPGTNLFLGTLSPLRDGQYWAVVTNLAGSATSAVWNVRVVVPGAVGVWGTNVMLAPEQLTNAIALAGGGSHALALTEGGTVLAWGNNDFGQTNVPPGLTNIIAVAAGTSHSLALKDDGSVVAWGRNDLGQTNVPGAVTDAIAISAGGQQSLALRQDGTVVQWGRTNGAIPYPLANVTAIASGTNFHLALLSNTTVVAWASNGSGQTNVPGDLSNVVAIAAGGLHALALKSNGALVSWGDNWAGQTNVPSDLTNAMAIAAGAAHGMALRNDGTVVAWGDNTAGQTNVPAGWGAVKLIAAGGDFTLTSQFSPLVQYQVDVTKDLLLLYNSSSVDSSNLCAYYLAHRPGVGGGNVLGVACDVGEFTTQTNCNTQIMSPVLDWLVNNPTKHPQYIVLFYDIPTRLRDGDDEYGSVSYHLYKSYPGWPPFVMNLNAGTVADCQAYINKLEYFGTNYSPGKLLIGASTRGYGNTNYYFDDTRTGFDSPAPDRGSGAQSGVLTADPTASVTYSNAVDTGLGTHITVGSSVAAYFSWGEHSTLGETYAIDGSIHWAGSNGWWIIETVESFNGERAQWSPMGSFIQWLASNAFGGADYSNTPVGAVTHVEEPGLGGVNDTATYFGLWARGKNFAICAWNSRNTPHFQAVGDPLVTK